MMQIMQKAYLFHIYRCYRSMKAVNILMGNSHVQGTDKIENNGGTGKPG